MRLVTTLIVLVLTSSLFAEAPAYRSRKMLAAELAFKPSVFSEDRFPECEFLEPDRARDLLGDHKLTKTFDANDYDVVETQAAA